MSEPLSRVILYQCNVLTPAYKDTYYFSTRQAQATFFASLTHKDLTNSQVTRISHNQIKVPFPVEEVRQYDYLKIENQRYNSTSQSTMYDIPFYCFIDKCEYVSNMCTLITFSVDVLQTFLIDATLPEAFIERCHTNTDWLFDNREPEPFTISDYTVDDEQIKTLSEPFIIIGIVAGTTINWNGNPQYVTSSGTYLDRQIFSGSEYFIFDPTVPSDMTKLEGLIDQLANGYDEAITDFYLVPRSSYTAFPTGESVARTVGGSREVFQPPNVGTLLPTPYTPVSGYTPLNNKLHNYPFTRLRVMSSSGDYMDLKFEEFADTTTGKYVAFTEASDWYIEGCARLYPWSYSMPLAYKNRSHCITMDNLPHCSWSGNIYERWKAQKLTGEVVSMGVNAAAGVVGTVLGSAVNPTIGAIQGVRTVNNFITDVGKIVIDEIETKQAPNVIHTAKVTSANALSQDELGWVFERLTLTAAEAEQIDNFFTMFGYAQNKIMNVRDYLENTTRPKFCYIKTNGFNVQGAIENDYKLLINQIFNTGITFWKPTATIGDYSGNSLLY